uniref:Uncharacterized protein n=1 Tax=Noccaea caerulescens TaxID=107243 RepID=A0A1J3JNM5_NOCCA
MRLVLKMQNEEVVSQHKAQEKLLQVSMIKKHEELMRELEARENELRLLDETIKEKSTELVKKEESFHLKVEAEAKEIAVEVDLAHNRKLNEEAKSFYKVC